MTSGLVLMASLAWLGFAAIVSATMALGYPAIARRLVRWSPDRRVIALRSLSVAPLGLGIAGVLLCFAPKGLGTWWPQLDHCAENAGEHLHFCLQHPPIGHSDATLWSVVLVAVASIAFVVSRRAVRLLKMWRAAGRLVRTARPHAEHAAWVLESGAPVALSVGAWRSRTLLSRGLLERAPFWATEIVIAHERAHAERRDAFWHVLLAFLAIGHLPATSRAIGRDLALAVEQACDERAARVTGSRERVAAALLVFARLRLGAPAVGVLGPAFDGESLPARVESLLDAPPERGGGGRRTWLLVAAIAVLSVAAADPLHRVTETMLHHLMH